MNEATFTRNINKRVEQRDPQVVAWKISDRFNSGRPDCHYLLRHAAYVEYKFERCAKLPSRHTATISALQERELDKLYAVAPTRTKVIVGFQTPARDLIFVVYDTPEQWKNSTNISELRQFTGYTSVVELLFSLIS